MCNRRFVAIAAMLAFTCSLDAHETLFGRAPGLMWLDGNSFELESEYAFSKRMFEDSSPAGNPDDEREYESETMFRWAYGVLAEWGVGVNVPYMYMKESSKSGSESASGLGDISADSRYRIYFDPFMGGSYSAAAYGRLRLPTAKKSDTGPSLGDGTVGISPGINYLYSSLLDYYWLELNSTYNTEKDDHREGGELNLHFAYATRLTEIVDFREFDFIVLGEADFTVRDRDTDFGKPNVDSGYEVLSLGAGVQLNVGGGGAKANFLVGKFGVNVPVYRRVNGTQMVEEWEMELSIGFAF